MASDTILEQLSRALTRQTETARAFTLEIRAGDSHAGTGLLWRPDVVVTSEQSLGKADAYDVKAGGGNAVRATLAGRDPGTNIAVLKLEAPHPGTAPGTAEPVTGSLALAFGTDGHGGVTVHLGTVSALTPEWRSRAGGRIDRRIALDVAITENEDGGPVLDASGALIGMATLGHHGTALAIPAATITRSVEQLLQYGRVERGWLGVALQPVAVPDEMRATAGQDSALMVMSADKGGPAAAAGITTGDVLLKIDGTALDGMHALSDRLGPGSVGQDVKVTLIRAGAVLSVSATVAARPASSDDHRHEDLRRMGEHWKQMAAQWREHHHRHHRGSHRHGC
ncbi:MAG TPA: S1C family serine protease [Rhizomicrobium sp.]